MNTKLFALLIGIMFSVLLKAIDPEDSIKYVNWQNLDPKIDKTWGISTDRAYNELLVGKEPKKVVVAVIDNGVDINHTDLLDHIWVNEGEIPENGIDDDNNGYIDDVNGWNFLGNSQGENINEAPLEVTRLYSIYKAQFDSLDEEAIRNSGLVDYTYYKKVVDEFESENKKYSSYKGSYEMALIMYNTYDSVLTGIFGKSDYTQNELKGLKVEKKSLPAEAKAFMLRMKKYGYDRSTFNDGIKYFNNRLDYHLNAEFNSRTIIGDDIANWADNQYGNNQVSAADPDHGTMVSGIIAANRFNNIGMKGIAPNVVIMPIRTVPDGDEWDKDVALAIQYAIDNGAEIINMSFGKSFSPQKEFVDKVVKMADEKNVLLVHAAGNDNSNIDIEDNFPNKYTSDGQILANNWITVGASAKDKKKNEFVADFSNYGKKSVDLFAPGHNILTTKPGNAYDIASGTSFSAPMVSGAAALIKSYYPNLTAAEIKEILLQSSTTKDIKVLLPGTSGKEKQYVPFSSLSQTGGLLNVYAALQLAEIKSKEKKQ